MLYNSRQKLLFHITGITSNASFHNPPMYYVHELQVITRIRTVLKGNKI